MIPRDLADLSPLQKRTLIAENDGWTNIHCEPPWNETTDTTTPHGDHTVGATNYTNRPIPNYPEDIREMREAVLRLPADQQRTFAGYLLMQVGAENREGIDNFVLLALANATQWANAYLLTVYPAVTSSATLSGPQIIEVITAVRLERIHQVFADLKKHLAYDKGTGTWSWVDRDEVDSIEAYHGGFTTALAAMVDATEPYLEDDDSEGPDEE